ncbi:OFA family MFS transporter [Austwickia sp. TVS 96-490-7B]|uniref:L-lactate MFS transporter n=1 Tax=Austwickia sp. TVS 96-490-7B TaxID=2830843 RepID=UPI00210278CE|nr:OFA family MFS transporter [Austwickia sp. TVS 96-490-7B]
MTTADPASTSTDPLPPRASDRWVILAGAVLVQLALGAVYAWSTFSKALQAPESALRLSTVEATIPFETAIGMIFVGTFLGGRIQDRRGPRTVAVVGMVMYAAGIVLSSFAQAPGQLWLLILGYGVLGGIGLGLAYIVPIALLQKWFPDKAGLITGIAVGGFGFGAVITSPVAQTLIEADKTHPAAAFLPLGLAYLVAGVAGATVFRNPPAGWSPAGVVASGRTATTAVEGRDFTVREALGTRQWYLLTVILTVCVTAGISLVSVAAASATAVAGYSAAGAAGLVGVMGLFNGAGRIGWAALSDRIGKMPSFVGILALEGIALILLPRIGTSPVSFAVLAAIIYTCYGGAFGALPSTAGQFFGVKHAGSIYGLMLVAWSIGGVSGPLIASALIGSSKNYVLAYTVIGAIALIGAAIPVLTSPPPRPRDDTSPAATPATTA